MEKPTLQAAIEWGKFISADDRWLKHEINRDRIRRLVEAGEFEREFCKQAWWWRDRKCPDCVEKDRRIEELREQRGIQDDIQATQEKELQTLRRQLDELGKEKAEVERHAWKLDQDIIKLVKDNVRLQNELYGARKELQPLRDELDDLRSRLAEKETEHEKLVDQLSGLRDQLAEKEQELDKKDRRYEKMDEGYSHQIASLSMEIERLRKQEKHWEKTGEAKEDFEDEQLWYRRTCEAWLENDELKKKLEGLEDELDDLRLSTTPGFVDAMGLIDEGLTKGKLEIEKVRKVTKLLPDDEPTDAEVEKVAARLHYEGYSKPSKAPTDWDGCAPTTKLRYRRRARHVIERGYRREQ